MGQSGANNITELLDRHGFRFSKTLGQNFLVDANIPEKIVRLAGIDSSGGVLEVGPGVGALTVALCGVAGHVLAVELDKKLLPVLDVTLAGFSNVEVIQGDVLKLDLAELTRQRMPGFKYHACSNIPYSITTPILTALIESGVFETITVMIQKEVARRICATPGSPEYSAFTVFVNYHNIEQRILFDVPPECFIPRPKVYSSVLFMRKRQTALLTPAEETMFFRVVRASFRQRRKTLLNALHAEFGSILSKDEIAEIIGTSGFDKNIRGERLGADEFIRLSGNLAAKV